ncbi:MAG: YggS family pyridoxal phosphate-dependent enzyme, partial [Phocaeicola sp.]
MHISETICQLHKQLPSHVRLVAVSKYHTPEAILEAYNAGQRIFGESKVQEMT